MKIQLEEYLMRKKLNLIMKKLMYQTKILILVYNLAQKSLIQPSNWLILPII